MSLLSLEALELRSSKPVHLSSTISQGEIHSSSSPMPHSVKFTDSSRLPAWTWTVLNILDLLRQSKARILFTLISSNNTGLFNQYLLQHPANPAHQPRDT
ncbi:hypothetical protein M758_UG209600 [Ceratodon purpureus]|nr:hypothetical protein M758_UG209600 [Ceratodon purpureus]